MLDKFDPYETKVGDNPNELPYSAAQKIVTFVSPTYARFDCGDEGMRSGNTILDVWLMPNNNAKMSMPVGGFGRDAEDEDIPAQDAWGGLHAFLEAAGKAAGHTITEVQVGPETLAHLYGQRILRPKHLLEDNITDLGDGVMSITLPPQAGETGLTLFFHRDWRAVKAGPYNNS